MEYRLMRKQNDNEAEVFFASETEEECKAELKNLHTYYEDCDDDNIKVGNLENWGRRFKISELDNAENIVKYAIMPHEEVKEEVVLDTMNDVVSDVMQDVQNIEDNIEAHKADMDVTDEVNMIEEHVCLASTEDLFTTDATGFSIP